MAFKAFTSASLSHLTSLVIKLTQLLFYSFFVFMIHKPSENTTSQCLAGNSVNNAGRMGICDSFEFLLSQFNSVEAL